MSIANLAHRFVDAPSRRDSWQSRPHEAGARRSVEQLAKSAPDAGRLVTIQSLETCREGGTASVPFQDRDHGMTMDRPTMIFFLLLRAGPLKAPLNQRSPENNCAPRRTDALKSYGARCAHGARMLNGSIWLWPRYIKTLKAAAPFGICTSADESGAGQPRGSRPCGSMGRLGQFAHRRRRRSYPPAPRGRGRHGRPGPDYCD